MQNYFNRKVFIIASLGNTHDGNIRMAKKLIIMCKRAKVDAVKFQKRNPELYPETEYITPNFEKTTIRKYRNNQEFWKDEYDEIDALCAEIGMDWYVSLYDLDSLEWMEKNYKLDKYKIPSSRITNLKLIKEIAKLKKLTFMSTGMSTIKEADLAIETFLGFNRNLVIMHCSSVYPASAGDINLRVMRTLHKHYQLHTGYDSHDIGEQICLAAVGMGAKTIEKHITLDRATLKGSNHAISMEPNDLEKLVKDIRDIEKSFGKAHKELLDREIPFRVLETGEDTQNLLKLERSG